MEKKLDGLRWKCMWVTHLGCIKGCLDYLKIDVSDAWLFGATGHAFIINIHEIVCPSGPTAWNTEMLFKLGNNIGYNINGVCGFKSENDFTEKQKLTWENTKKSIDNGIPCYGWELDIPEYYVVYGYNDVGYYFSGPQCDSGKGHKPWNELGKSEIGVLEMHSVRPSKPADDIKTIKDAFEFVLEHSKSPSKWIFPKYKSGLAGYDSWIKALETDSAHNFGMAYNSAVWSECRQFAVKFLQEAKSRLNAKFQSSFDEVIKHYKAVAENLKIVADTFPFLGMKPEHIKDNTRIQMAIKCLKLARNAEESGLKVIEKILSQC